MANLNDLKLITLKGEGFFCKVKKYSDEASGKLYALKELKRAHYSNPNYRYRLSREIKLLEDLKDCGNIIDLLAHGDDEESERLWYLMPFADYNLYEYIKKYNQSLTMKDRFDVMDQVISAIKHAHSLGILHRDISANNVLVFNTDSGPVIKVSDFGLGKNRESLSNFTNSSASGYGQTLYVSPEQRDRLKDATTKSDIYSLGKLVYFVFTGKDPYEIKQFELKSLVSKATEENPDQRHSDIDDFIVQYNGLKELLLTQSIPLQHITLYEILKGSGDIDYNTFHEIASKGIYREHVFYDYLSPVTDFLLTNNNLSDYYKSVGSNIRDFIRTYSQRIDECLSTTRWPFSSMDAFGELLTKMVESVSDDETKLICFKQLWFLAFIADQWAVQRSIKTVLTDAFISSSIASELSEFIISTKHFVDLEHFDNVELPKTVKLGIIKCNEIAKNKPEKT